MNKMEREYTFIRCVGGTKTKRIVVKEKDLTDKEQELMVGNLIFVWENSSPLARTKFLEKIIQKPIITNRTIENFTKTIEKNGCSLK